jgi:hypothetical protein
MIDGQCSAKSKRTAFRKNNKFWIWFLPPLYLKFQTRENKKKSKLSEKIYKF